MKKLLKTSILLLFTTILFQHCSSGEPTENTVSIEDKISIDLSKKIINTATSISDYNFYNKNVNLDYDHEVSSSFINSQGDYFHTLFIGVGTTGFPRYTILEEKQRAFKETGIHFTYDDFFIHSITNEAGDNIYDREGYLDFFKDGNYEGENNFYKGFSIPLSDINFSCNALVSYVVGLDFQYLFSTLGIDVMIKTPVNDGIIAVENQLIIFNDYYNTSYTLNDVRVNSLHYSSPEGNQTSLYTKNEMLNYFDDCSIERDINNNDCLNFVYPIQVNRFSIQLEEVITSTIANDEELITTFNTDIDELVFIYPIRLLGQDESIVEVETNEALENALDNSSMYCN